MKKILIVILLMPFISFAQLDTLFFDDFSDNQNNWSVDDNEYNRTKIENGKYVWTRKSTGSWSTWWTFNGFNQEEFLIQITCKIKMDGAFGIFYGGVDANNARYVTLDDLRKLNTFTYSRGDLEYINRDFRIKKMNEEDYNTLTLHKKDNIVTISVNGEPVLEEFFSGFLGNKIGLTFNGQTIYYVDEFLVMHKINLVPDLFYTELPVNLGENINTSYSELQPIVTPDGKGLYFDRVYYPGNAGGVEDYEDIYFAELGGDGNWKEAVNVGKPLNNTGSNGVSSVTPDGNTLFLINTYKSDGTSKGGGASMSNRTSGGWEVPQDVEIIDYYNDDDYKEMTMSNDKTIMVYAVERDEGYGERDLYVSFLMNNGNWSVPLNLGPGVNTPHGEMSPFIASDNRTIYFSSSGHPGYGSNDIFLTRRLDDTWTNWSTPQNIGKPINSSEWDAYYSVPASGEYAYYVSNTSGFGNSDVFKIKLPETVKPLPVVLVKGKALNKKTDEPLEAIITYLDLKTGKTVGSAISLAETGNYQITLPAGKMYGFLASAEEFISVSENIDLTELEEYTEIERDLYLVPMEIGEAIRLNNIFFETAKWDLLPESYAELDKLVEILNNHPTMQIQINGHTDNVGSDIANKDLSQKRAASVVNYLLGKGIESQRLDSAGFGETQPVATNDTDEGRALNRRVEFVIVKK